MYDTDTSTLKHLRMGHGEEMGRQEYMMDLGKNTAQGLDCGFQAVGIPEKEKSH